MAFTKGQLRDLVRSRLEELSSISQVDALSNAQIDFEIDEAALHVYHATRKQLIYPAGRLHTHSAFVRMRGNENLSVIVPVPNDFVRFLRARIDTWINPVDEAITVDTNEYFQSQRRYFRLADKTRPSAVMIPFYYVKSGVTYRQAFELFPCPDSLDDYEIDTSVEGNGSATGLTAYKNSDTTGNKRPLVPELIIVTRDTLPTSDATAVPFPDALVDVIVWAGAANCFIILRQFESAKVAMAMAEARLGTPISGIRLGLRGETVNSQAQ